MTAVTMTRDPDLDKAIDDLQLVVKQMRWAEERLCGSISALTSEEVGRLEMERDEARSAIRLRALTLQLPWRTLLLFVEETDRLQVKHGRRPSVVQMQNAVEAIQAWTSRTGQETDATIALMRLRSKVANDTAHAASSGLAHMAASR